MENGTFSGSPTWTLARFGGNEHGALGLYQIVIEFPDDRDERDAVFAELAERFPEKIRVANL